jgi:hypothetical protein
MVIDSGTPVGNGPPLLRCGLFLFERDSNMSTTRMNNAAGDPLVTRNQMPEHYATEPAHWLTSMLPRIDQLVPVQSELIRNHQTVLFSAASKDIRLRALRELQRNALDGDDEATAVLRQWEECGLKLE